MIVVTTEGVAGYHIAKSHGQVIDRMSENATTMGANAVVRMMFDSSEMGTAMNEVVAYGTAVTIEPD